MTFEQQIATEQDSEPVDLYRFVETTSAGEIINGFTDYAESITFGGVVYETHTISRGGYMHTCLLYTSPSPRDKRQSRMPSSA